MEDINDCVPQFGRSSYYAEVQEGSAKGFSILTITVSDCDYKPEYTNVTLSLSGNGSGKKSYVGEGVCRQVV